MTQIEFQKKNMSAGIEYSDLDSKNSYIFNVRNDIGSNCKKHYGGFMEKIAAQDIQAFPGKRLSRLNPEYEILEEGMTLRDYFAAKALNGLLSCTASTKPLGEYDQYAMQSYAFADAMLAARQGEKS